jgi:hypothetical protein
MNDTSVHSVAELLHCGAFAVRIFAISIGTSSGELAPTHQSLAAILDYFERRIFLL